LYLVVSLLTAVVLITSSAPLSLLGTFGVFTAALSLVVTAYTVTERRSQLLLTALLSASALLPFAWVSIDPDALAPSFAKAIYSLNPVFWLLFTFYVGLTAFRAVSSLPVASAAMRFMGLSTSTF